ncbi:P-loop containing nucleoside triphosphate hydrolase protein [Tricladium varicosporioides]|nr:P-loop containing nucleoside triphosphate hydrolase protein [Hymenoscyphus varicosporioides]
MQKMASTSSSSSIGSSDDWVGQQTIMNGSNTTSSQPDNLIVQTNPDFNFIAPNLQRTDSLGTRSKILSREFNNIKDEAELGKIMGDDGEKLLALVDDIRKIDSLRNEELHIPQIVVIGDTSTGKSSILQALTRLPFPVARDLCTRFVTETTIRRCGSFERPGYKIEVKMDSPSTFQVEPFSSKSFESDKWVEVYQQLREDIDDAFDKMSPTHLPPPGISNNAAQAKQRIGSTDLRSHPVPKLLKHRLQITVRKPNQAHFSIVDIPGLVSSGAAVDVRLSVELARQYIQNEEAIVLAVTPANNLIVNQKWFNLVTEEHALDRTIGVITKTDTIQETDHEIFFSLLRNYVGSEHYLKLGWFAVRNRSTQEILDKESFEERDRKEDEFFGRGKWKDATLKFPAWDSIDPKVLGIQCLKRALQGYLYKRVKENFPRLKAKMRKLENEYSAKIQSMGDPRENPRDQRVYLSEIQTMYEAEAERSLNGNYRSVDDDTKHPSRLRYHVKSLNDQFESEIRNNALSIFNNWQSNDEDDAADKVGILTWINNTWDTHRGSEPRHDAPRSLKKELVKQQTKSWETKTKIYIEQVENAIKACNDDLFMFTCKDDTLRFKIREKLEVREMKAFKDAKAELESILRDRDYIDSWNPQLDIFTTELQHLRMRRQVESQLAQQEKKPATESNSAEAYSGEVSARLGFYLANKMVYEVHDWLYAYWKVSYPRFVDNVIIQVVERHLLGPNGPLRLFHRNWIFELEDAELEDLVGENKETRAARKDLKERLAGLKNALKKADIVLRSRTNE